MNEITILSTGKKSPVFSTDSMEELCELIDGLAPIVIIDENVNQLYPDLFKEFPKIVIHSSEQTKTLETVAHIYAQLIELGADRHSFLLAIGGGIISDIVGFVASTYMRGIRFAFVATTLMAQVDAAIGGKNGVNFQKFKNMIGTFTLPEFVWCNINFLKTLPTRERNAGFAEIIKYGLIQNPSILEFIETNLNKLNSFNPDIYKRLVEHCIQIKTNIVNTDAQEHGLRKTLNFGHTLGHAIEKCTSTYNHGEAVSIGMIASLNISKNKGFISSDEIERIKKLLHYFGLPIEADQKLIQLAINEMAMDKKKDKNFIDFILLTKIGQAEILPIEISELKNLISNSI